MRHLTLSFAMLAASACSSVGSAQVVTPQTSPLQARFDTRLACLDVALAEFRTKPLETQGLPVWTVDRMQGDTICLFGRERDGAGRPVDYVMMSAGYELYHLGSNGALLVTETSGSGDATTYDAAFDSAGKVVLKVKEAGPNPANTSLSMHVATALNSRLQQAIDLSRR